VSDERRLTGLLGLTVRRGGKLAPAACAITALVLLDFAVWKSFYAAITRALAALPDAMRPLVGGRHAELSTLMGFLAVAFQHPLPLALLSVAAIGSAARAIAGEVETGTADLLFARPVSRTAVLAAQVAGAALRLLVIVAGFPLGIVLGATLTDQWHLIDFARCLGAAAGLYALFLFVFGYALVVSAAARSASTVHGIAAGLTVVFFLMNLVGDLAESWEPIRRITPFGLFRASALMSGTRAPWLDLAVLLVLAGAAIGVAWWLLRRRDL
jgi:ABC-2 type transport system permease protein